ncbi:MAG: NfeD family protein [Dehalococcoidia bacterium]|jgi:membrane-bound serine protease (ClpP class)
MDAWLIVVIAICAAALVAFIIQRVVLAHRKQVEAGREELVGKAAEVETELDPRGIVLVEGERWAAIVDKGRAKPGEEVIITKVDGLKLLVTRKE